MADHLDTDLAKRTVHRGTVTGLQAALEAVAATALARTPVRTGRLRASQRTSIDENTLTGAVSYDTAYAVREHESTYARHQQGQAKFLETAAYGDPDSLRRAIAASVHDLIGD